MGYFVRKLEELPVSKVEGAHGGTGVLEVVQLLGNQEGVGFPGNPDDFESDVNFLHRLVLPQGTCIGMHKHVNSEEFYYIRKRKCCYDRRRKRNPYATSQCFYDKSGK